MKRRARATPTQSSIVNPNRQWSIVNSSIFILQSAFCILQSADNEKVDREYKQMMMWVLIALVASVLAAVVIVEWVVRRWG